jgi:hypothetical protein
VKIAAIAACAMLAACAGPSPGAQPVPRALDQAAYVRDVHPILEARCATLDCHGSFDRPLRIYSETGLRRSDELRGQPITPAELADDVAAATAIDGADAIDDSLILVKPLGRMKHTGGTVWTSIGDPEAACVRGWLAGTSDQPDVAAACAIAATQVALPPP